MTQADNIRPYALGVKYKILRNVEDAVPYALIQNISVRPIPICQTIIARVYIAAKATLYVIKQRIISVLKFMQKNKKQ